MIEEIKNKMANAQMILVGIGEKADLTADEYNKLSSVLCEKNYFIVDLSSDNSIENSEIKKDRVVLPVFDEDSAGWDTYLKWLSGTLNRELVVIELGVGFDHPDLVRFPFEKTVLYNNKAYMVRINSNLYQLPAELKEKGCSLKSTAKEFIAQL